jgi:hypothetical protein
MDSLRRTASQYGYQAMQQDAMQRVLTGQTSLSEARRLVFFDTSMSTGMSTGANAPLVLQQAA